MIYLAMLTLHEIWERRAEYQLDVKNQTNEQTAAMKMYVLKYNVNYLLRFPLLTTDSCKCPVARWVAEIHDTTVVLPAKTAVGAEQGSSDMRGASENLRRQHGTLQPGLQVKCGSSAVKAYVLYVICKCLFCEIPVFGEPPNPVVDLGGLFCLQALRLAVSKSR